jgi:hypothetical protein
MSPLLPVAISPAALLLPGTCLFSKYPSLPTTLQVSSYAGVPESRSCSRRDCGYETDGGGGVQQGQDCHEGSPNHRCPGVRSVPELTPSSCSLWLPRCPLKTQATALYFPPQNCLLRRPYPCPLRLKACVLQSLLPPTSDLQRNPCLPSPALGGHMSSRTEEKGVC